MFKRFFWLQKFWGDLPPNTHSRLRACTKYNRN